MKIMNRDEFEKINMFGTGSLMMDLQNILLEILF